MTARTAPGTILGANEKNHDAGIINRKLGRRPKGRVRAVCGRCGGSGWYSFHQVDGGR